MAAAKADVFLEKSLEIFYLSNKNVDVFLFTALRLHGGVAALYFYI